MNKKEQNSSELILYQTEDGKTWLEACLQDETVWITQDGIAELYRTTPQNVILHLKAIYVEGELDKPETCKECLQVKRVKCWDTMFNKINEIKKLDFFKNIWYIINSIPAAPLLKSMRNPVGFCFYRGFVA